MLVYKNKKNGFSLLELMIVMVILGILVGLVSGNFFTSLKKGRDAKRKADLAQIQRALEMYYEDKQAYPTKTPGGTGFPFGEKFCETGACGSDEKVYMENVPDEVKNGFSYQYDSDGTYYYLLSCIENTQDQGVGVSQNGYSGTDCGSDCGLCKYLVSSPNVAPLPTNSP